jgi:hypothetical protein
VLRQTTIYRRGDARWLLSPPLDEFWGEWITSQGDYLNLIYPARDEAIAERLAADLDNEIGRLCETLTDINCSADLRLTMRLDTDPATLAVMSRRLGALRRAREREDILELPTPTLVGIPIEGHSPRGEAAYEALRDGYAPHLLGAVVAQAIGWQCCDDALLFSILLDYQLSELGHAEWPVGPSDYRRVLDSRLRLSEVGISMRGRPPDNVTDEERREMQTAVDFLLNAIPDVSAARLQRAMDQNRNFNSFLNRTIAAAENREEWQSPANFDLSWWLYALGGREALTGSPPPIVEIEEDLYMACTALDGVQPTDLSRFLRFSPVDEQWTEIYNHQGFIWMSTLADPQALMLQEFDLATESWQTNVWRDNRRMAVYVAPDGNYSISFGQTNHNGQRLVAYAFDRQVDSVRAFVIDLEGCDGDCPTSALPGLPTWSPDSGQAIYAGNDLTFTNGAILDANHRFVLLDTSRSSTLDEFPLALGPGDAASASDELISVGLGRAPFWLDNRTFGFIHRADVAGQRSQPRDDTIYLATVDNQTPEPLLSADDLAQFLPDDNPRRRLSLGYVAAHPTQPRMLVATLLDDVEERAYVFIIDRATRQPELRMSLLYTINHSLSISPDGRYILLTGQDRAAVTPNQSNAVLLIHDIAENRTIPLLTRLPFFLPSVVYDWTEDGRWLAVALEDNLIGVISPEDGAVHLLPHGYGACTSVAWLQGRSG